MFSCGLKNMFFLKTFRGLGCWDAFEGSLVLFFVLLGLGPLKDVHFDSRSQSFWRYQVRSFS